ncbi:hypothetical protein H5407_06960 [Mitsuaria sp. WAJ17]|uniref:hypothetical protein n=1 Tax=Mitsuaria sp. WAJ17 TaxID=2761452 RepID=UPI00160348F4|nr:hypothetical protein [Mitsuaria sp. WAJ17]MBB2484967.1 hypothetical protein [Mitsuaria sp. WAJ17]
MPRTAHPSPVPRRRQLLLAACAAGLAPGAQAQAPPLIRHNMADGDESMPPYRLQVLRLLLERTQSSHGPYELRADASATTQSRALAQLRAGDIDVWASMCSRSRQDAGLSIPICLRRGVNGVRLPVVLAERRSEFEGLRHQLALRTYRFGQVSHWPDARVLAANGFKLEAVQTLEAFPAMLRLRRFDIFLLAADEAHAIVEAHPDLRVLDDWCLAYPSVYGFFVNARLPALAIRLREGWARCLADGSFAALFDAHLGPQIQRAQLGKRLWLRLTNPDLPEGMPLRERTLWHPQVWQHLLAPGPSLSR